MTPEHSSKQIPLDPKLRERALQVIELYKTRSTAPASASPTDQVAALVPTAMKTIEELVHAYDHGELSVTTQRQLIATLKKIVRKYGVSNS
jgi:hypothetical protein